MTLLPSTTWSPHCSQQPCRRISSQCIFDIKDMADDTANASYRAGLAGAFTAVFVGCVLVLATPAFQHMMMTALGAIVISSVAGLLQWREAAFLWQVRATEFA